MNVCPPEYTISFKDLIVTATFSWAWKAVAETHPSGEPLVPIDEYDVY